MALLFVIFHTVAIVIYAMPYAVIPHESKGIVTSYVNPVFDQKWNMFAPCPKINSHFRVKYYTSSGDSTRWYAPAQEVLAIHQNTRVTHFGELVLAESNLGYWLNADMMALALFEKSAFSEGEWQAYLNGFSYRKMLRYFKGYAKRQGIKNVESAKIVYRHEDVGSKMSGTLTFPKITLRW